VNLFGQHTAPLAERVRPRKLSEIVGQEHLTSVGSPLHRILQSERIPSLIFWGPPGVGKTTLASVIANESGKPMASLSAISSGVKEVREVLARAESSPGMILFIDEIHRFNKSQQDALLASVERGIVTLIGATTENPGFEVNPALRSRCQIFVLNALDQKAISQMVDQAIEKDEIVQKRNIKWENDSREALFRLSGGDGRKALNIFDMILGLTPDNELSINVQMVTDAAASKVPTYDKGGEYHYDVISAFIKSLRGGDPNAAVYWLALMLEGGEDIKFIARRMIILASEDIGNANPNALLMATTCFQAIERVGMPESRIILSQTATYLACSPKSNAAYLAINEALSYVRNHPQGEVPLHLRNAPVELMKNLGYGEGYKYSHDFEGNEGNQQYMPDALVGKVFYRPKEQGKEKELKQFLMQKWKAYYS
jgi:putative ATPase